MHRLSRAIVHELNAVVVFHTSIIAHEVELYGVTHALVDFLKSRVGKLLVVKHPFYYCEDNRSRAYLFVNGVIVQKAEMPGLKLPEVFSYLKDLIVTPYLILKFASRKGRKFNLYIGADCLNALVGIFLHRIGVVQSVVFYGIDYTPRRFKNPLKNSIYQALNKIASQHSDFIWNVSCRMAEVRERFGVERWRNLVVLAGTYNKNDIKRVPSGASRTLVIVSHLTQSKGIQLAIRALPKIVERIRDANLFVIGTGPYEKELKHMVKELHLDNHVEFLGPMHHGQLMSFLPKCGIALATYVPDPYSITVYADPIKIKDYLACGLPIIVTKVPEAAYEVEHNKVGLAIDYSEEELAKAVVKVLTDEKLFKEMRENALELAAKYDYERVFADVLEKCIRGQQMCKLE